MNRKIIILADLKASFTIEAAVVVPLVMIMLVTVIYAAFYVHNAVTIAAVTDAAILEQSEELSVNWRAVSQEVQKVLIRRLIGETEVSVSFSGDDNERNAFVSAEFQIPLAMIDDLTGSLMGNLSFRTEVADLNGRKKLLLYKSICDGVSELVSGGNG